MEEDEMIAKLKLTPEQLKAFSELKRALKKFEKAGGVLVGNNEHQYALNGRDYVGAVDYYSGKPDNSISIDDAELDCIVIQNPFIDAPPYIVVSK